MEKIKSLLHGHSHSKDVDSTTGDHVDPDYKKLHGTYHDTSLDEHGRGVIPGKHYDEEGLSSTTKSDIHSTTVGSGSGSASGLGTSSGLGEEHSTTSAATTTTTTPYQPLGEILPGPAHIPGSVISEGHEGYTPALKHLREHGMGASDASQYDPHLSGYSASPISGNRIGGQEQALGSSGGASSSGLGSSELGTSGVGSSGLESSGLESSGVKSSGLESASESAGLGSSAAAHEVEGNVKPGLSQAWAESH